VWVYPQALYLKRFLAYNINTRFKNERNVSAGMSNYKKLFVNIIQMKRTSGFTLIELLVVIAIIGILSSVVLASLNTARGKGADAAIKSNLAGIRAQSEILYDTNGSYTGLCTNANVVAAIDAAKSAAGVTAATVTALATAGTQTTAVCHLAADNGSWAISVPMRSTTGNSWCVDSTGSSDFTNTNDTGFLAASDLTCN
jgi:prepilin-type N-terminal cleavage/methylation domain-containing protein